MTKEIEEIIFKIRIAMACCCSENRHKAVNKLLDKLEKECASDGNGYTS